MNVFKDKLFGNGENYVYYKRLETDPYFKTSPLIFSKAKITSEKYKEVIKSIKLDITSILRSQAEAERQKEINVLRTIDPQFDYDSMSPVELINQINKLIGLRGQYENYLRYIRDWYPTANNGNAKNMSPVVSSYMSSKIATLINKYCEKDLIKAIGEMIAANGSSSQINQAAEKFANKVIDDFISDTNNMTTELLVEMSTVNYTLGEENLVWEELLNQINEDASVKNKFITDVMNRFGLQEKVKNAFKLMQKKKYKTHKGAMRKAIELTAAPQGGFIYEVLTDIMQGFAIGSNISTSRISDKGTTDLLTAKISFDYKDIVNQKVAELESNTRDKAEAVQKMTEFSEFLKNNVGEGFIIYGNAKSYRLDRLSDKEGYFHGGTRNIKQLPSFMAQYEIPISQDTVELIINTIPGAILEGNLGIQEFLTEALAGQVAKLLFDDWTTIGDDVSSFNAIHVFNLNGITVPLSYLLENMAVAAEKAAEDLLGNPSSYFQVEFNLPENIMFPDSKDTTAFIEEQKDKDNKKKGGAYLQRAWEAQRTEALQSTFGINFLSNFNSLLNELMSSLGI